MPGPIRTDGTGRNERSERLENCLLMPYRFEMITATATYEEIEDAILHLPIPDRSRLATRILESLEDDGSEISPEWQAELDRRVADIDSGETKLVSSRTVWGRVNDQFGTDL